MSQLDPGTFGGYQSSRYLIDVLNSLNNDKLNSRVSSILNRYFSRIKDVGSVRNKLFFGQVVLKHHQDLTNNIADDQIRTLILNIMKTRFREVIKEC